jgi:hypothetical protein
MQCGGGHHAGISRGDKGICYVDVYDYDQYQRNEYQCKRPDRDNRSWFLQHHLARRHSGDDLPDDIDQLHYAHHYFVYLPCT